MSFDISTVPPDIGQIAAERERLSAQYAEYKRLDWRYLAVTLAVLLTLVINALVFGPDAVRPENDPTVVTAIVYFTPYTLFAIFITANTLHVRRVEKPKKAVKLALAALEAAPAEDLTAVAQWCASDATIAAYRAAVAGQGRDLLTGETAAMRARWQNNADSHS